MWEAERTLWKTDGIANTYDQPALQTVFCATQRCLFSGFHMKNQKSRFQNSVITTSNGQQYFILQNSLNYRRRADKFDVHRYVHRNIFSYNQQDAPVSQIIYSCKTLYMFRTVFPSIIRSSKLHIRQQACVKQLLLPAASGSQQQVAAAV